MSPLPNLFPTKKIRCLMIVGGITLPVLLLSACGQDQALQMLMERLKRDLQPKLELARARSLLDQQGITYSVRPAAECDALARESRLPTQIAAKGGPCVFGKAPGHRNWYGAHTDVIFQLVFSADEHLADGHFEAIEAYF